LYTYDQEKIHAYFLLLMHGDTSGILDKKLLTTPEDTDSPGFINVLSDPNHSSD
jgi:hypothetical protein